MDRYHLHQMDVRSFQMATRLEQRQRRWTAPMAAAAGAIALSITVWIWASKKYESGKGKGPASSPARKKRGPNPTLCLSFACDPVWTRHLHDSPEKVDSLIQVLEHDYVVHALICAPDDVAPPLACDRLLLYSTPQGRAMLARALVPHCHVEIVFVDKQLRISWGTEDSIPSYLTRLDQLAQVVHLLMIAVIPVAHTCPLFTELNDLKTAFRDHPLSKRGSVRWMHMSPGLEWEKHLAGVLREERDQTWA